MCFLFCFVGLFSFQFSVAGDFSGGFRSGGTTQTTQKGASMFSASGKWKEIKKKRRRGGKSAQLFQLFWGGVWAGCKRRDAGSKAFCNIISSN